ncbi:c-type cytochrome [Roseateles depolymerans]|uniref:Cytochrome c5 n=1 Tax=Roseateles depolymerans TaxID=76731 RepID=A0A0U3LIQ3_9BURK|nr:c-type cytochrome [Roseateles depolymerans]ALV04743.1 Cytochrome c5 [Roseateles depolymerans]REG15246.1 cytochrome c5 [Roseateles depolymerans]
MSGTHDQSPATHAAEAHDAHEGPIKTPKQLIAAVFFAFVIPIAVLVLAANYVSSDVKPAAGSDITDAEAVAARIQPVGTIDLKDMSGPAVFRTGEEIFKAQCAACHATGTLGAPKFGDADAWAPRLKTGFDTLLHSALKGKGAMPPQGGGEASDYEIARAVVYMANNAGGKLEEPKAPVAASAASQ